MKRTDFLGDQVVTEFLNWLEQSIDALNVNLQIKSSRFCPGGIKESFVGIPKALEIYRWKSQFKLNGKNYESINWTETKSNLERLGDELQTSVLLENDDRAFDVCGAILSWGGERNPRKGARIDINQLHASGTLSHYLKVSKDSFHLIEADLNALSPIKFAGSMWTKVYSLHASDGLPIYDSRVAAAIAGMVEIYRVRSSGNWKQVPRLLEFGFERGTKKRDLRRLNLEAIRPRAFNRGMPDTFARRWSSCKVRLGWLTEALLVRKPELFSHYDSVSQRAHAFEAALFMIGSDLRSLANNL